MSLRTRCSICKKLLTNPLSAKLGIGPVCRAGDSLQGVFEFMRAQFSVFYHEAGKCIFIEDTGHRAGRSVANDAEYVIERLYLEYGLADGTRIFYKDSGGRVGEMLHSGKKFAGFKAGHEGAGL